MDQIIAGNCFMGARSHNLYPSVHGPRALCRTYQWRPVCHHHHHHHHLLLLSLVIIIIIIAIFSFFFYVSFILHQQVIKMIKCIFKTDVSSSPTKGSRFSATKLFTRKSYLSNSYITHWLSLQVTVTVHTLLKFVVVE